MPHFLLTYLLTYSNNRLLKQSKRAALLQPHTRKCYPSNQLQNVIWSLTTSFFGSTGQFSIGLRYRECDRVLRYLSLWIGGAEFLTIQTPFLSPGPGVQTHCRHNEQNTYILDKDFDLLPTIVI